MMEKVRNTQEDLSLLSSNLSSLSVEFSAAKKNLDQLEHKLAGIRIDGAKQSWLGVQMEVHKCSHKQDWNWEFQPQH